MLTLFIVMHIVSRCDSLMSNCPAFQPFEFLMPHEESFKEVAPGERQRAGLGLLIVQHLQYGQLDNIIYRFLFTTISSRGIPISSPTVSEHLEWDVEYMRAAA